MSKQKTLVSDPQLVEEVKALGAVGLESCFNCGSCTAVCPLSTGSSNFPRRMITYTQLGLRDKILESPDLWLCSYCGECTRSCPRQADPAETMMALRRYAIINYAPPGFSSFARRIYRSSGFAWLSMALITLIPLLLMFWLHGPIDTQSIRLFTFFPEHYIDIVGVALGVVILGAMVYGVVNMYLLTTRGRGQRIPVARWAKELYKTVVQDVLAQKRIECSSEKKGWKERLSSQWFIHMSIFWGFAGLLLTTTLGFMIPSALSIPLTNGTYIPVTEPIRVLGTVSGLFLVYGSLAAIFNRLRKSDVNSSHSYFTDWSFLVLLLLAGLTGYALELVYYAGWPIMVYSLLTVHLTVVFDLLVVAPFTKFAHSFYRPIAIMVSRARDYI